VLQKRPREASGMQGLRAVAQSKIVHTYGRLFFGQKVVAARSAFEPMTSPSPVRLPQTCRMRWLSCFPGCRPHRE